ncbi:hypothetical protein H0H81_006526 [Sphagnurus paluster]|uniref:WW domain-containing protein n=1 Tax=Sphagnurus paluster TaxID=117069 RepID=A0A9P7KKT3_9AGAR|nr:hypothetical protein H0H81_006526 [Sphagnurus paluster]
MAIQDEQYAAQTATESKQDAGKDIETNVENDQEQITSSEVDSGKNATGQSADSNDATPSNTSPTPASTPWQAIFAPQYNAYYFYNTETQETTWENPLQSSAAASTSTSASSSQPADDTESKSSALEGTAAYTSQHAALQAAALAAGIDPSLAHLDPSLLSSIPSSSGAPSGLPPAFTAKFNARTGQFARPDARDPTHLSEHARAARMSEFYFDVNAWEKQLADQGGSIMGGEEEGKKRKRPSKKDLERFREQKKQKKIAKTAWLRT